MIADQIYTEFTALIAFVLAAVLVRLWFGHAIEALREDLFTLRDEMMIYAYREGLIDDLSYRNLRFLINGFIRYAHKLSFARLVLIRSVREWMNIPLTPPREAKEWRRAVNALPENHRAAFEEFNERANLAVIKHMILWSPILWSLIPFALAHVGLIKPLNVLFDRLITTLRPKMPMEQLEHEALKSARLTA